MLAASSLMPAAPAAAAGPGPASTLTVVATTDPDPITTPGQVVTFSFAVTNTVAEPVTNVAIVGDYFSGAGGKLPVTCPSGTLAGLQTMTCTATYRATQADIDEAGDEDRAHVTGTLDGTSVASGSVLAVVDATRAGGLHLDKTVTPGSVANAGDQVTYGFTVHNTGNVTILEVHIVEGAFTGTNPVSPPSCGAAAAALAPGESVDCTASYTATSADISAGSVTNHATAAGKDPSEKVIASNDATAVFSTTHAPVLTQVNTPALTLVKSVAPASVAAAGGKVTYTFTVTNSGNVPVDGVGIAEGAFTGTGQIGPISCGPEAAHLAVNASVACTATYALTQADIDAGKVTNTATAGGTAAPATPVTSGPSSATVTSPGTGSLQVAETGTGHDHDGDGRIDAGDTITWTVTVTNTGPVTLHNVTVSDPGAAALSCPLSTLAPAGVMSCTVAPHQVSQADVNAGEVTNSVTANGTTPAGAPVGPVHAQASVKTEKAPPLLAGPAGPTPTPTPTLTATTPPATPTPAVTAQQTTAPGSSLPFTGFDTALALELAALAAVTGSVLVAGSHRSRRKRLR